MANYYITDNGMVSEDALQHYGVVGMKWGVRRARKKATQNTRLEKKSLNYDKTAASLRKHSEKVHMREDLGVSYNKGAKAAQYDKKAAQLSKKALKAKTEVARTSLEKKSERAKYKAAKNRIEAERISKITGYGSEAMKYSVKSDEVAAKAAKARMQIANNNHYISMMKRKASSLSDEELRGAYSFVNEWLKTQ